MASKTDTRNFDLTPLKDHGIIDNDFVEEYVDLDDILHFVRVIYCPKEYEEEDNTLFDPDSDDFKLISEKRKQQFRYRRKKVRTNNN